MCSSVHADLYLRDRMKTKCHLPSGLEDTTNAAATHLCSVILHNTRCRWLSLLRENTCTVSLSWSEHTLSGILIHPPQTLLLTVDFKALWKDQIWCQWTNSHKRKQKANDIDFCHVRRVNVKRKIKKKHRIRQVCNMNKGRLHLQQTVKIKNNIHFYLFTLDKGVII